MRQRLHKRIRHHILAALGSLLLLLIGFGDLALGQQLPPPDKVLNRMDSDRDGRISQAEWLKSPAVFSRLDADADGYVTFEELSGRPGQSPTTAPVGKPQGSKVGQNRKEARGAVVTTAPKTEKATYAWVDTHVHLRRRKGTHAQAAQAAIKLMDASNIRIAILMPPPFPKEGREGNRYDVRELSQLAKSHPGRFAFLGGGDLINGMIEGTRPEDVTESIRAQFVQRANQILDAGARGFGEMGMMHLGHFSGHPSYWVAPDHPLFLLLAEVAGERNAVIDIHMDVVETDARTPRGLGGDNPPTMKANVAQFERFLSHDRRAKVILAHAGWDVSGQWSPELSRRLLDDHPNLYMSFKIAPDGGNGQHSLLKGAFSKSVPDEWIAVIRDFPDRFVIGSDSFFSSAGTGASKAGGGTVFHGDEIATLLKKLPGNLARRVAMDNAVAIYGRL